MILLLREHYKFSILTAQNVPLKLIYTEKLINKQALPFYRQAFDDHILRQTIAQECFHSETEAFLRILYISFKKHTSVIRSSHISSHLQSTIPFRMINFKILIMLKLFFRAMEMLFQSFATQGLNGTILDSTPNFNILDVRENLYYFMNWHNILNIM